MQSIYRTPSEWRADESDTTAQIEFQKVRRIDPLFVDTNGTIRRLSDVDTEYAEYLTGLPKYFEYKIKQ